MTPEQIKDAMTDALSNKIEDAIWDSAPEGTFSYGSNAGAIVSDMAKASATAVMALVGPKPLVWVPDGTYDCVWDCVNTDNNQYRLMHDEPSNEYAALIDGVWHWCDTQALAQAAAQAHADAAHWGNTGLGDCHAEGA